MIVDDVFDTGLSIKAVKDELRRVIPTIDIKVAVPWYKPKNNRTSDFPEFYLHQTENWLVFPHELVGLSRDEIARNRPQLASIFSSLAQ